MSNCIQDDLTHLPLSRQYKYQLRMRRRGRCRVCGKPATQGSRYLCLRHLVRAREQRRKEGMNGHQRGAGQDGLPLPRNAAGATKDSARQVPVRLAYRTKGVEMTASVSDRGGVTGLGLPTLVQTFLTSLTWMCSLNGAPTQGWLALTLANKESLWRVARNDGDSSSLRLIPVSGKLPAALRRVTGCFSR